MSLILFWKTLSEIALYFSFAHFIGGLAGATDNLLRQTILLTLAATLAAAIDRKGDARFKLRWLALVALYIPAFRLCDKWLDAALLAIPAVYVFMMTLRRSADTSYYEYQRQYKFGLKLMCAVGVMMLMAWQHPMLDDYVLPYVLIYMVSGVLALRLMRHSDDMQANSRLWVHNVLSLIPVAVAGLLITSPAAGRAALATIKFIFYKLIYPIIALFTWIMSWIMYALFTVASKIEFGENPGLQEIQSFAQEMSESIYEQGEITTLPTEVIMGIFLTLIFGGLLFMMLRFLRKNGEQRQNSIREVRSRIEDVAVAPREMLFDRSPRAKVRAVYRKFIGLCVGAGAQIRRTDTTEDIERMAQYALAKPPQTGDLKDVYRRARYSAEEITEADVSAAKAAYQAAKAHWKKIK